MFGGGGCKARGGKGRWRDKKGGGLELMFQFCSMFEYGA